MIKPTRIVRVSNTEQEIHMIGSLVGVCWNLQGDSDDMDDWTRTQPENPYICFPLIREYGGELYRDDDLSIEGGISSSEAMTLAQELLLSIKYLNQLESGDTQ